MTSQSIKGKSSVGGGGGGCGQCTTKERSQIYQRTSFKQIYDVLRFLCFIKYPLPSPSAFGFVVGGQFKGLWEGGMSLSIFLLYLSFWANLAVVNHSYFYWLLRQLVVFSLIWKLLYFIRFFDRICCTFYSFFSFKSFSLFFIPCHKFMLEESLIYGRLFEVLLFTDEISVCPTDLGSQCICPHRTRDSHTGAIISSGVQSYNFIIK